MKKLVVILVAALIGGAGGAGAGLFLKPSPEPEEPCVEPCEKDAEEKGKDSAEDDSASETTYVSLNNQFVVPIIFDERVTSFVVIALSLEIAAGEEETIYSHEPKLQDAMLRVMFDHAYMGGFSGAFTESERMLAFRDALRETAAAVVGDILVDVLITEMVRQEV